jgi:hypothetical protein
VHSIFGNITHAAESCPQQQLQQQCASCTWHEAPPSAFAHDGISDCRRFLEPGFPGMFCSATCRCRPTLRMQLFSCGLLHAY